MQKWQCLSSYNKTDSLAITSRYGSLRSFMNTFNPKMQNRYCHDVSRCFFGTAPTLGQLQEAYGKDSAASWVIPQLYNLSEYCGAAGKLTKLQYIELSTIIAAEFHYLKVTELMLFFYRFKSGRYGHFYGSVDPLVITCSLQEFINERGCAIAQNEQEERERRNIEEREGVISYDEYLRRKAEKEGKRL